MENNASREDETENDTDDEYANDPVTIYLKEYRKKQEAEKVSMLGGPRAHSQGFHRL